MIQKFEFKKLGVFTYNILADVEDLNPFLSQWLEKEWRRDLMEFPEQPWTKEWLTLLSHMTFRLEILELNAISLRADLMSHQTQRYSFREELQQRATEREESMLRGVSIEPVVVNKHGWELMDGYTRYTVLRKYQQRKVYAYVGQVTRSESGQR